MDYVVIGDGAAGMAGADAIRSQDQNGSITLISDDPNAYYYRAALTNYLSGQLRNDQLWGVPAGWYSQHGISRVSGLTTGVDVEGRVVQLDDGRSIAYERLLIASGASPIELSVPGADLPGVMTFRTLRHARAIVDLAPIIQQAVVVGSGPLGLEWVQGLRHLGVDVSYLLRERLLMPRLIDEVASEIVLGRLRASGVAVILEDEIAGIHPGPSAGGAPMPESTWPGEVVTRRGRRIPCQLVGVAIGVRPNLGFLQRSPIAVNRGVLTDRYLRASVPDVFAAGDVAHVREAPAGMDLPSVGLWQPARRQGAIAGFNMVCGNVRTYEPGALYYLAAGRRGHRGNLPGRSAWRPAVQTPDRLARRREADPQPAR